MADRVSRLAPVGASRGRAVASLGPLVVVAGVLERHVPTAVVGPEQVDQAGRLMYRLCELYLAVLFSTHGNACRGTSRHGHGPRGLCDRVETPSRWAPGLPLGTTGRGTISACAANGAAVALRAGLLPG